MANIKSTLSVIGTTASRLPDLPIKNGQLVFLQDVGKIALDFKDTRTFYNEIVTLQTDEERKNLENPIEGSFYFVIDTSILWTYQTEWKQLTSSPQEVLFIGIELPELGSANKLFVNTEKQNISVWDEKINSYRIVSDTTKSISNEEIDQLFI
mgnify:CR=1 FL=1